MRTRLVATMTAVLLAAPFLSATALASTPTHKCPHAVGAEHKCPKDKG
jgi:hypothetical protein